MSATAIYLVLLNFPEDQRYKHKNMYLAGVIPGPGKPSLEQINHVLSLIVKELLEFWKGVYFTRTGKFLGGRFSKGALIPLVCDMLATRQIAGLGSVNSKFFCTFCLLTIQEIKNLDKSSWPERRLYEQLVWARQWKECPSEHDRESLFKLHGVRWSALLDLPYWNPILFSVLDQMHAAYLGLYHTHCRRLWGIDLSVDGGDGTILSTHKSPPGPKMRFSSTGWISFAETLRTYWHNFPRRAHPNKCSGTFVLITTYDMPAAKVCLQKQLQNG